MGLYMLAQVTQAGCRMGSVEVDDLRTAALMLTAAISTYSEDDNAYDEIFEKLLECRKAGAPVNGIDTLIYQDEVYQIWVRVRNA